MSTRLEEEKKNYGQRKNPIMFGACATHKLKLQRDIALVNDALSVTCELALYRHKVD